MRIWLTLLAISAAAILLVVLLAGPEEGPDAEAGRGEEPRAEQEAVPVEGAEEPAAQSEEARALLESVLQTIEAERERVAATGARSRTAVEGETAERPASPEEREALRESEAELEREMGREAYDRMLYAAGETNRVRVRFPIERSPGADAGLEPGDVVLEYNGHSIYQKEDLHALARSAPPKTEVPIVLLRDGVPLHAEIRSGPLGTFFEEFSEQPQ